MSLLREASSFKEFFYKKFLISTTYPFLFFLNLASLSYAAPLKNLTENLMIDNRTVEVTPLVTILENSASVRLVFFNREKNSILVMEGINGFGIRGNISKTPSPIMDDEYTIVTNGKKIDYIGPIYKRAPYTIEYFKEIKPNEVIDVRFDRLDTGYEFHDGTHEYELVHHHLEYDLSRSEIIIVDSKPVKFILTKK